MKMAARWGGTLLCAVLGACTLPGGRGADDAMLLQKMRQLEEQVAAGQKVQDRLEVCPVSIADLSASGGKRPFDYMCLSERRLREKAGVGTEAGQAAGQAAGKGSGGSRLPAPPCPPDAHLYQTEEGDGLIVLARIIARPGEDWRAWAAAMRLRNAQCFDAAHGLSSGCQLIIPAVARHRLVDAFAALWEQGMRMSDESPLQECQRLWRDDET